MEQSNMSNDLSTKITDLVHTTGKKHEASWGFERKYEKKYFRSYNDIGYGSKILFYKTKLMTMGGHSYP